MLGFALGLLLSGVADVLDGGGIPVIRLILAIVLIVGIVMEIMRVRRSELSAGAWTDREGTNVS